MTLKDQKRELCLKHTIYSKNRYLNGAYYSQEILDMVSEIEIQRNIDVKKFKEMEQ